MKAGYGGAGFPKGGISGFTHLLTGYAQEFLIALKVLHSRGGMVQQVDLDLTGYIAGFLPDRFFPQPFQSFGTLEYRQ